MTTTTHTVTITEIDAPSRSKAQMWAYTTPTSGDNVFASRSGRSVEVGDRFEVVVGGNYKRATRVEKVRVVHELAATGNDADVVTISTCSPQSYVIAVTGAVEVTS